MQLNAEDGGHRQCILVTNNENNICEDVTYVRNQRVIQGYTKPNGETVEGLHSNNLRYYKTTFIPREKTMANKRALTAAATDLLCIKNNVYQEIGEFGGVKLHPKVARYFDDGKTRMLVIYIEAAISKFVDLLLDMEAKGKILVYVFSTDNYAYNDDFDEVLDKVELCALPDAIYKAYKKFLPSDKIAEDTESSSENESDNADEEDEK
jgi:adenine-specific DNA-methyltransferase